MGPQNDANYQLRKKKRKQIISRRCIDAADHFFFKIRFASIHIPTYIFDFFGRPHNIYKTLVHDTPPWESWATSIHIEWKHVGL